VAKLGVWRVDSPERDDEAGKGSSQPRPVQRSHIELERHLEDWIANDSTLIAEGLTIVGRQTPIDEGRLDLLAIDSRDRWVVIEIKPGLLDSGALIQALGYASSIARLNAEEISEKLDWKLSELGDKEKLSAAVRRQLNSEQETDGKREIAVLLVGVGIAAGLERTMEFLGDFGVPIIAVSFEVFELDGGPTLLVRERIEERVEPPPRPRKYTREAIQKRAAQEGVEAQFNRFVKMSEDAGLAVQPQKMSVRIAPQANRTRFLMYASPAKGGLVIWTGPKYFPEFFDLSEAEAHEGLGPDTATGYLSGQALDERLDRIQDFFTASRRKLAGNGDQA